MKKEAKTRGRSFARSKKAIAYWQIYLMLSLSIAMAFAIGESDRVGALTVSPQLGGADTVSPPPQAVSPTGSIAQTTWKSSVIDGQKYWIDSSTGEVLSPTTGKPITQSEAKTDGVLSAAKQVGYSNPQLIPGKDGSYFLADKNAKGYVYGGSQYDSNWNYLGTASGVAAPKKFPLGITDYKLGNLVEGVVWAAGMVSAVQLVGGLFGMNSNLKNTLSVSLGAGVIVGKGVYGLLEGKGKTTQVLGGAAAGLAVAFIIFAIMYKKETQKIVKFECLPWQAPIGGSSCEQCNKDPFKPCSEYRCKALGQACQLLNPGTSEEKCAWVNPKDTKSPMITPWNDALKPLGLKYTPDTSIRPPALGVKIVSNAGGCLQAFTPLEFGILTDKPAQCKIDYQHTAKFDDMTYFFGESNYFVYNHTEKMKLPSADMTTAAAASTIGNSSSGVVAGSPVLRNDGSFSLYVRCEDANGNVNVDEYAMSFCVDKGPDTTPPVIENTSIPSGGYVQYNADSTPIEVYVNEPADCKWSRQDKSYNDMENQMDCLTQAFEINSDLNYICKGNLTAINNGQDNQFYFRCKDKPSAPDNERNVNAQSYSLVLKGSQPLNITSIMPNGTITGSTSTLPVNLEVETNAGAQEGKAVCFFSTTTASDDYVTMFQTNDYKHSQSLDLTSGDYTYYIKCVDAGGNIATGSTSFNVNVDTLAPAVTRVYREGTDSLKIVTNKDAKCTYSLNNCNFNTNEGLKLIYSSPSVKNIQFVEWKPGITYYIRCIDDFGNEPNPGDCSVVASATQFTQ